MKTTLVICLLLATRAECQESPLTYSLRDFEQYFNDHLERRDNDVWLAESLAEKTEFLNAFMREATDDILRGPVTYAKDDRYPYRLRLLPSLSLSDLFSEDPINGLSGEKEFGELKTNFEDILSKLPEKRLTLRLLGRWAPPINLQPISIDIQTPSSFRVAIHRHTGPVTRYQATTLRDALQWLDKRGAYDLQDVSLVFPKITQRSDRKASNLRKIVREIVALALEQLYEREVSMKVLTPPGLIHLQRAIPLQGHLHESTGVSPWRQRAPERPSEGRAKPASVHKSHGREPVDLYRERKAISLLTSLIETITEGHKSAKVTFNANFSPPIFARQVEMKIVPRTHRASMRLERPTNGLQALKDTTIEEVVAALKKAGARAMSDIVLYIHPKHESQARRRIAKMLTTETDIPSCKAVLRFR